VGERETPTSLATPSLQDTIARQPGAQRLLSALRLADSFELEIVACPTPLHARALITWLSEQLPDEQRPVNCLAARRSSVTNQVGTEEIARDILDPLASAKGHRPVFLDASAAHLDEYPAWQWMLHRLNERRNGLAAVLSSPLIVLLPRWLEPLLPAEAPDLWSIRSVTVELTDDEPARRGPVRAKESPGPWIEDLEALHSQAGMRGDRVSSGSVADQRAYAAALRRYGDAALDRVDLEELSRRVDEELLPLTEALGDPIERARALRTQAAVRLRQGDTNAALEILQTQVLPIVEDWDVARDTSSERADTMEQIANVLATRGDLDGALWILLDQVLPVHERLGNVRSQAVTMGKIADILQVRGNLDEALRIRREDELPVYDRLGDLLSKTVTMGKIADILQDRGDLDEALRIHREETLPVLERLGGRDLCHGLANLGSLLIKRGRPDDLVEARRHLERAIALAQAIHIPFPDALRSWLTSRAGFS
jgi:tetratricopeptide (TPR) repeat protein